MQASASAIATPPSATSCAEDSAPPRTAWRIAACSAFSSPRSADGSGPATGSPRSLDSSDAARRRRVGLGRDQRHGVAFAREPEPPGAARVRQLTDQPDDRRRVDRALGALVVERDVAAHDRHAERAAGVAEAGDGARELPRDVRLLGVAEVQAVRQAQRLGADAGEVGRALEHGLDGAAVWVGGDAAAVAVDRDGDRGPRAVHVRRRPQAATSPFNGVSGSSSTAASACSGRRTVREPTTASYCSNAHRRDARLAEDEQRRAASSRRPRPRPAAPPARDRRTSPARPARGCTSGTRRRAP